MFTSVHNHTAIGSNIRGFLDSTNRVDDIITYGREIGYSGIAITDHDCIAAHLDAQECIEGLRKKDPDKYNDYKLILGNEIYLCSRTQIVENKDYKFYHFILLAKDEIGHRQIRELSTRAWCENSFYFVNIRTPTYFEDLFEVVEQNRGHVIGSTACLGSQTARLILDAYNTNPDNPNYSLLEKFLRRMIKCFGEENFFLEMQPSEQSDQIIVNRVLLEFSKKLNIPYIITTDSHYKTLEDRKLHEVFLKSNDSGNTERELGEFYTTTYLQTEEEIHGYMDKYLGYDVVQQGIENTSLIYNACTEIDLRKPLDIPYYAFNVEEPDEKLYNKYVKKVPLLKYFYESKVDSDRHLCRDLINRMAERPDEFENEETYKAMQDCLDALIVNTEKQNTPWSAYLLTCRELVDTVWESGSLCAPGRGSGVGYILLYMLDIIQVNPLREETQTFYWRFLHSERQSVVDIDSDTENSKKDLIIENLRKKYGGYRHVTKVQTILTSKAKNAIQTAARGLGYLPEEGTFLASFIKAERGIQHSLAQTFYGDIENNIAPDTEFVNLMTNKYPDIWEAAQKIEGLCVGVGSHAGGLVICTKDIVDSAALMKTGQGDIITQLDLHKIEKMGLIKYDLLNTDCLEKIHIEMDLLLEDKCIEWQGSLKDTYEKYLGVYQIERKNPEIWDMINKHKIISLFQFEKQTGWQCIEMGQPQSLGEMAALNSVMRLMAPEGSNETPLERYQKFKKDINLWYKEMEEWGLTEEEQKVLEKYALHNYGLLPNQENFMQIVQDPQIGGFSLIFADSLRKAIAKKNPKQFDELTDEFYKNMEEKNLSPKLCRYVWEVLVKMNKGYGFNLAHTLAYSIIALQEANLAYHFPIIYWNCANLISDSGGEDSTVKYGKIASAVGRLRKEGINIVPPYINDTKFDFRPLADKNEIIFGLKPVSGIGTAIANAIVENQPYVSMQDFYDKMQQYKESSKEAKFGDTAMIQLIKAGCFDELENKPREEIMADFIRKISNPISKLKIDNIEDLNRLGLLTDVQKKWELRLFRYKRYVFTKANLVKMGGKSASTGYYKLEHKFAEPYFIENFQDEMEIGKDYETTDDGYFIVKKGAFDRVYDKFFEEFKLNTLTNQKFLDIINQDRFNQIWDEKASGTISQWEMDSLNYYYHDHALAHIDRELYEIKNFDDLSVEPQVSSHYYYRGQEKMRYKLCRICGTVIDKDKNHNTVTLLTPDGVVVVRLYKGQFGFYDRELSRINPDGTKTKIEKSWFKRGTNLLVTGFRNEEQFIPRKYNDSIYKHTIQKILSIDEKGMLSLQSDRAIADNEGEEAIGV